ncbi:hypothetical protein LIER_19997 [Lithospermum erythrorhizon]|uniref:Senescence regulator n=1 Tax=Lithospermum erythrorhizon TaxID=34254 RepID=A0AAV3QKR7_LITER
MAASKGYFARANYRFFSSDPHAPLSPDAPLELDESDIWNAKSSPDLRNPITSIISKKLSATNARNDRNSGGGATHRNDSGGGYRNDRTTGGGGGGGRSGRNSGGGGGDGGRNEWNSVGSDGGRNDWVIGGGGGGGRNGVAASVPVNVPDWSKILKEEYRENRRRDSDDDEDDDVYGGDDDRIPPHEYVARHMARARIASFSVHEGVGRTLKGRDLSRVRNAIWEKTGFQD